MYCRKSLLWKLNWLKAESTGEFRFNCFLFPSPFYTVFKADRCGGHYRDLCREAIPPLAQPLSKEGRDLGSKGKDRASLWSVAGEERDTGDLNSRPDCDLVVLPPRTALYSFPWIAAKGMLRERSPGPAASRICIPAVVRSTCLFMHAPLLHIQLPLTKQELRQGANQMSVSPQSDGDSSTQLNGLSEWRQAGGLTGNSFFPLVLHFTFSLFDLMIDS